MTTLRPLLKWWLALAGAALLVRGALATAPPQATPAAPVPGALAG